MKTTPQRTAYTLLRMTMGVNFLGHGLVRFSKLDAFRDWMVGAFQNSILPSFAVTAWGSVLPFLEFGIGLLLILGLFTYRASIAGALVIITLILGSTLIENWEWVGMQMIYGLFFYFLISKVENDVFSLSNILLKNK